MVVKENDYMFSQTYLSNVLPHNQILIQISSSLIKMPAALQIQIQILFRCQFWL